LTGVVITPRLPNPRQVRYSDNRDCSGISMTDETLPTTAPYGERAPGVFDKAVIAMTSRLPVTWLGLRLAIGLRRLVTMRLPEDGGLDVERWGLRMRLHPRHNGCEKNLLFTPQFYETPERAALAARIDPMRARGETFVFIDIGANVGLFSLFVASRAGGNAYILAIEPEHENLRRLFFNVDANRGLPITVLPHALGDAAGVLEIEPNMADRGGARTRRVGATGSNGYQVECKPLIQMLRQEGVPRIDALKIDVEGFEDRILMPFFQDAPQSLWPRFIIIEDSRESWGSDLFAEFQARGYKMVSRTRQNVMLDR
jgi:FkbM family methyltransferase